MSLNHFRKKIDKLDKKLVLILARRMQTIQKLAEYKKKHTIPAYQSKREQEILKLRKAFARRLSLDTAFVEVIFKAILKGARKAQKRILKP